MLSHPTGHRDLDRVTLVVQAWTVLADAHADLEAGVPVRHTPELVYGARYLLADEFDTTDLGAWNLVRDTRDVADAELATD